MTGQAAPFVIHVAGDYDEHLGQLCSRCGIVLDDGLLNKSWPEGQEPPRGWPPGAKILRGEGNPTFTATVSALEPDRDTSDEAPCAPLVVLRPDPTRVIREGKEWRTRRGRR